MTSADDRPRWMRTLSIFLELTAFFVVVLPLEALESNELRLIGPLLAGALEGRDKVSAVGNLISLAMAAPLALNLISIFFGKDRPFVRFCDQLRPWLPGLYVSLGLIGTFLAITLVLPEFGTMKGDDALTQVMAYAGLAFRTSVVGIGMSVVIGFFNRILGENQEEQTAQDAAAAIVQIRKDLKSSLDAMQGLAASQGQQLNQSFERHLSQFGTQLSGFVHQVKQVVDGNRDAATSLKQLFEQASQNTTAVSALLDRLSKAANLLTEQTEKLVVAIARQAELMQWSESHLGELKGNLESATNALVEQVRRLSTSLQEGMEAHTKAVEDTNAGLSETTRGLTQTVEAIQGDVHALSQSATQAAETLNGLSQIDDRLRDPFLRLAATLDDQFSGLVEQARETVKTISEQQQHNEWRAFDAAAVMAAVSTHHADEVGPHVKQLAAASEVLLRAAESLTSLRSTVTELRQAAGGLAGLQVAVGSLQQTATGLTGLPDAINKAGTTLVGLGLPEAIGRLVHAIEEEARRRGQPVVAGEEPTP